MSGADVHSSNGLADLRRSIAILRQSGDASGLRVAEAVATWLGDSRATALDSALGLRSWGGTSIARKMELEERDRLIRRLWTALPEWSALRPPVAARLMAQSAERYEAARWPRERNAISAPSAEPSATWWHILSAVDRLPKAKRIQQILEAENVEIQDGV